MNTTTSTDQDLGPLIWVRGEIDLALVRAAEALGDGGHQAGAEQLKFAQTHLHQARGALAIVDAEHIVVVNDNNFPYSAGRVPHKPDDNELVLLNIKALRQAR